MAFLVNILMLVYFLFGLSFSFGTAKAGRQNECHPFSYCNTEVSDSNGNYKQSYTAREYWRYKYDQIYTTHTTTSKPRHYYRECCDNKDIILLSICLCVFLMVCFVLVPYCLHYKKCGCSAPNTASIVAINNDQDRWTTAQVASVPSEWTRAAVASIAIEPPPDYPGANAGILDTIPSAPYLSSDDVNEVVNDDPPSYYEVMASS